MTTTEPTQAETIQEPGCYIDSHHGIYSIEILFDLVAGSVEPWKTQDDDRAIISHSLHGDIGTIITLEDGQSVSWTNCNDFIGELYDELTERLPVADGYCWHWEDGELFYSSVEDAEEMYA